MGLGQYGLELLLRHLLLIFSITIASKMVFTIVLKPKLALMFLEQLKSIF